MVVPTTGSLAFSNTHLCKRTNLNFCIFTLNMVYFLYCADSIATPKHTENFRFPFFICTMLCCLYHDSCH